LDRVGHRVRDLVRVHVNLAGDVAGGTPDGLDQRGAAAQEAFLVRIQDGHQRDLGQVQALAQQVDAHQDVEGAHPQFTEQLHAAQRVHDGVQVLDLHAVLVEV